MKEATRRRVGGPTARQLSAKPPSSSTWLRENPTRIWYAAVLLAFAVLVATGITTSSVGIELLQFDSEPAEEILSGAPRAIRSDEWMRNTPLRLGIMRTGDDDYLTPLTAADGLLTGLQGGISAPLVFFDATVARLGPILPDRQLFALLWWLPYLFVALGIPVILRFLGARPWIAVTTALLILLSPTVSWWSLVAPNNVGTTAACGALLVLGYRALASLRKGTYRWVVAGVATAASAILVVRLALSYPPWTIPLGLLILLPLGITILMRGKAGITVLGGFGLLAVAVFAEVVLANIDSYRALASTAYPGARRSTAGGVAVDYLLGAFFAGYELATDGPMIGINQSELATGYTILPVAALAVAAIKRPRLSPASRPFVWVALAMTALLGAWSALPATGFGAEIPILNLLPPHRIAQVVGVGALVLFGVLLEHLVRSSKSTYLVVGASLAVLVAMTATGYYLRSPHLPGLELSEIAIVSAVVALGLGLMLLRRAYALIGAVALLGVATFISVPANPVMVGLGDLRGAEFESVRAMMQTAADDRLIAGDHPLINAFTQAAGLESLSGEQAAPSSRWLLLDPERVYEEVWNRGAIVVFSWDTTLEEPIIESPQPDVVVIRTSPCDRRLGALGLGAIVSSQPLASDCLSGAGSFTWGLSPQYIYAASSSSP